MLQLFGLLADVGAADRLAPCSRVSRSAPPRTRKPVERDYRCPRRAGAARRRSEADAEASARAASVCHTAPTRQTMHAIPGGAARLHRLPWRRRRASARRPGARHEQPDYASRATKRAHVLPRYPESLALPAQRQPAAQLHAAQPRGAGIRPLHQPVRLSRRARGLRRLPHRGHRGGRALADVDRRDAVGRRGLQQRHPAVQELHPRRGLYRATASRRGSCRPAAPPERRDRRQQQAQRGALAEALSAAGLGA